MADMKGAFSKADVRGPRYVRLSVNLGVAVAEMLRGLADRHGVSVTEELRRAISVWKYLDDHFAQGDRVLIESSDGSVRELVVPG